LFQILHRQWYTPSCCWCQRGAVTLTCCSCPASNPGASARLASGTSALEPGHSKVCTNLVYQRRYDTHTCAWLKRWIYVDSCRCTNMSLCRKWKLMSWNISISLSPCREVAKYVFCYYGFASVFSLE
jgi:hypothetical protein